MKETLFCDQCSGEMVLTTAGGWRCPDCGFYEPPLDQEDEECHREERDDL